MVAIYKLMAVLVDAAVCHSPLKSGFYQPLMLIGGLEAMGTNLVTIQLPSPADM